MPDPQETFATFAEIAIALAGFSGIVIAFGQRSAGSLSGLEMRRLSNLFALSGMALTFSLLGLSVRYVSAIDDEQFWSGCSAVVFLILTPWLILDVIKVLRLDKSEKLLLYPLLLIFFYSMGFGLLLLQLFNWLFIQAPWPFFLGLSLIIVGAFQQFILLVHMGIRDDG